MLAFADEPAAQVELSLPTGEEAGEPREEVNFRSLLAELDNMEQGLKTDFSDLPATDTDEAQEALRDTPLQH